MLITSIKRYAYRSATQGVAFGRARLFPARKKYLMAQRPNVDEAKADGSFRADVDGATLVDAIVGAHIAERSRTGRIAAGWEERSFDLFWPTVGPLVSG